MIVDVSIPKINVHCWNVHKRYKAEPPTALSWSGLLLITPHPQSNHVQTTSGEAVLTVIIPVSCFLGFPYCVATIRVGSTVR